MPIIKDKNDKHGAYEAVHKKLRFDTFKNQFSRAVKRDSARPLREVARRGQAEQELQPTDVASLRIYCSGTGFDGSESTEIIACMNRWDRGVSNHDKLHLKGAGKVDSRYLDPDMDIVGQGIGLVDGYSDMRHNVHLAKDWLVEQIISRAQNGTTQFEVPIAGWSRGAVTAIWIANAMSDVKSQVFERIKNEGWSPEQIDAFKDNFDLTCNIFAIDPVAGPTNTEDGSVLESIPDLGLLAGSVSKNWHEHSSVSTRLGSMATGVYEMVSAGRLHNRQLMQSIKDPAIKNIDIVYAKGEKRDIMMPVVPQLKNANTRFSATCVNGQHSTPVKLSIKDIDDDSVIAMKNTTFELTARLAEEFSRQNGIQFCDDHGLDIELYSGLMEIANSDGERGYSPSLEQIANLIMLEQANIDQELQDGTIAQSRSCLTNLPQTTVKHSNRLLLAYAKVNYPLVFNYIISDRETAQEMLNDPDSFGLFEEQWNAFREELTNSESGIIILDSIRQHGIFQDKQAYYTNQEYSNEDTLSTKSHNDEFIEEDITKHGKRKDFVKFHKRLDVPEQWH